MATITLGGYTYTLVPLPSTPGFTDVTLTMMDAVAVVKGTFVPSQAQTQAWPGADGWGFQANLPKMTQQTLAAWKGWLAGLRGMANVFQVGDPDRPLPFGAAKGTPLVDGTVGTNNAVMTTTLFTKGWTPTIYRQLLAGDYLQIGYRLYMVCAEVDSDGNGDAQISVWPSLRDQPADGTTINLIKCKGVFRLSNNMRKWQTTKDHLSTTNFQAEEVR